MSQCFGFTSRFATATRYAAALWAAVFLSTAAMAIEPTGFHYLAADASLRSQMQNTSIVMGQATSVGKVLSLDQTWESPYYLNYPGSIVTDPATGQWRMYYELIDSSARPFVAMATSNDGVHWTKPALNVTGTTYTTNPNNNFICGPTTFMGGPNVFIDPTAPANQRYRMTEFGNNTKALFADTSADGLHWTRSATIDDLSSQPYFGMDAQNTAFWDPTSSQYIAYMRRWYPDSLTRRGAYVKRSPTWNGTNGTWTSSREFNLDPINVPGIGPGTNKPDIYVTSVVPYYGQYIGMPSMYYHPAGQTDGPLYPTFMYSRDSSNWSFEDVYHPLIDLSAHGQTEQNFGQAYVMTSLPERDGNLYIYYSYFPTQHNNPGLKSGSIYLATLREDRFVGIQSAPGTVGTWTTPPISISSDFAGLVVNSVVNGSLRVEVLDVSGNPIPGRDFSFGSALPLGPGDYLNAAAQWNGIDNLNFLAGRQVKLKFYMDDATVYGFHFVNIPGMVAGDYTGDGKVDASDYVMWRKFINTPATYDIWRQHFGQTGSGGAGAGALIPEPRTFAPAVLAVVGFIATCRRRLAALP